MRAASAALFEVGSEERNLVIACFNVLLEELAVATPSARQRPGNPQQQGLQLPAIYALIASDHPAESARASQTETHTLTAAH